MRLVGPQNMSGRFGVDTKIMSVHILVCEME